MKPEFVAEQMRQLARHDPEFVAEDMRQIVENAPNFAKPPLGNSRPAEGARHLTEAGVWPASSRRRCAGRPASVVSASITAIKKLPHAPVAVECQDARRLAQVRHH